LDPVTGNQQRQFVIGPAHVPVLAFSPDGQTLALGGSAIRLVDLATGKEKLPQFGTYLPSSRPR